MNKYEFATFLIKICQIEFSNILDVGCRNGILKQYLPATIDYCGIDVNPDSNCDHIVDISKKTQFIDRQFQLLIALDVAEHIDDIYFAISEMLRIADTCIIALPNMYKLGMRYRFFRGRSLCNKYALSIQNSLSGGYRHKWIFTPEEAIAFMKSIAIENDYHMTFHYYYSDLKWPLSYMNKLLPANLSAEAIYFIMQPNG